MTRLEALGLKISLIRLPALVNKLLVLLVKVPILWVLDKISFWFPFPRYKEISNLVGKKVFDTLEEEYLQDLNLRIKITGEYEYRKIRTNTGREKIDNGDSCLFSGLLAGYLIDIKNDTSFFYEYINSFIVDWGEKWKEEPPLVYLLRGRANTYYATRDDPSGDQLIGMVHAVSRYKKKENKIPAKFLLLVERIIADGFRLRKINGETPLHGNFAPGVLLHGGSASVILAALAVAEKWEEFNYLYNDCGYRYLLKYSSPWVKWKRAWYSDNVAMLALGALLENSPSVSVEYNTGHAIENILRKNGWNLWLWLLFIDSSLYVNFKYMNKYLKEGIEYFRTFRSIKLGPSTYYKDTAYWPLSGQNCDWVWQRSPFKKETNEESSYGRLDFLYVKGLLDKHKIEY